MNRAFPLTKIDACRSQPTDIIVKCNPAIFEHSMNAKKKEKNRKKQTNKNKQKTQKSKCEQTLGIPSYLLHYNLSSIRFLK